MGIWDEEEFRSSLTLNRPLVYFDRSVLPSYSDLASWYFPIFRYQSGLVHNRWQTSLKRPSSS